MLERIGNCRIVEEVASGGMAVVYRAIQDDLDRVVAIKALKTSVTSEQQLVTRFEREARSLAALQHENIIHIYDFHRERGALFIVMEYVQGIDLYDLLDRCGRLPFDVAAVIAMQVARALDYIHYRAIVHRDIKPANVMVSREGAVKVMDFGIARDGSYTEDLTQTGTGIGTPSYMSPEQILGDKLDARSDIFSLGVCLYQMVTGRKPFVEDEGKSVMQKIRLEKHVKARKLNPDIPRELERIIDRCLQKQPRDRFRSTQALVMALERFLSKHVDMNYHARLVLFLKGESIITQLEADEHLNPAFAGAGTSRPAQPNMAIRMALRRGLTFHLGVLAIVALMLALIHVAPIGSELPVAAASTPAPPGYVRVIVSPWGRILVDGKEVAVTPRAAPIAIPAGEHTLSIENDYFETVERAIRIEPGPPSAATEIYFDLEATAAPVERITVEEVTQ
ncbi:MAG TPA: serine/threonine-protein kinase [Kofleriaceae bacterium]|nr:serine/threonine-protein kinase [Kofleriaceae bacterium]